MVLGKPASGCGLGLGKGLLLGGNDGARIFSAIISFKHSHW